MARLKIGFIPIEGGHYYGEALEEVTRAEEPRLRLGVDGRAPLGGESLLAVAAAGARRLRHAHLAA